jgi:hypothetical protein
VSRLRPNRQHDVRLHGARVGGRARAVAALASVGVAGYALVVRGALTLDLGLGRRLRPLGPIRLEVAAPPETLFDVIADPYLGKTPRAMRSKLQVLERGTDMVLAAHHTPAGCLTATTVETVRFERPRRISFRLLRGPVPHVLERFELRPSNDGTELTYSGELGTDFWRLGEWWGHRVARAWEQAVRRTLDATRTEAQRRAGHPAR